MANPVHKRSFVFKSGEKLYRYTEVYEELSVDPTVIDLTKDEKQDESMASSNNSLHCIHVCPKKRKLTTKINDSRVSNASTSTYDTSYSVLCGHLTTETMESLSSSFRSPSPVYCPNSPVNYRIERYTPSPPYRPTSPLYTLAVSNVSMNDDIQQPRA